MSDYNLTFNTDKQVYSVYDDIHYTARLTLSGTPVVGAEIYLLDADNAVSKKATTNNNGEAKFTSASSSAWNKGTYIRTVMFGVNATTTFKVV